MTLRHPKSYHNHAAEYQVSGMPFVTSSVAPGNAADPYQIVFPNVTQFITVNAPDTDDIHIGFTENGVKGTETDNYFVVEASMPPTTFHVRCKEIWVRSSVVGPMNVSVLAGLTNCEDFLILTGSGGPHGDWGGVG
jgi:hypothetical protein